MRYSTLSLNSNNSKVPDGLEVWGLISSYTTEVLSIKKNNMTPGDKFTSIAVASILLTLIPLDLFFLSLLLGISKLGFHLSTIYLEIDIYQYEHHPALVTKMKSLPRLHSLVIFLELMDLPVAYIVYVTSSRLSMGIAV